MAPKEKPAVAVPALPSFQAALDELVRRLTERLDEMQASLPPEVQISTNQIHGIINDVLGHAQWGSLYASARADVFQLLLTGRSNVRHDPMHLA